MTNHLNAIERSGVSCLVCLCFDESDGDEEKPRIMRDHRSALLLSDEIEHLIVLDIWNNNKFSCCLFSFLLFHFELHDARVQIIHTKRAGLK